MGETMTDAAKKARAAYMREWRHKNPDKMRKANAAYWERKAEKINSETQKAAESGKEAG